MKRIAFILVALTGLPTIFNAQLVLDNTQTVEWYVNNVLLGSGVTATNITFNTGSADVNVLQVGSFDSQNANVGLESGLLLSSGGISVAVGPNNTSGLTVDTGLGNFGGTDPDLTAISSGFGINDWCIIEFDFVPTGDSIQFQYVWCSEEYMEWAFTSFNDVFGFFLSGPGINGTFSNNGINIAQVPGTSLPVTIDNVNLQVNSQYYVDNGDGFTSPYNTDDQYIQFDGFTVPLVASAQVQCGQTYHIKIALADSGDTALDCAVFLEEGSFSSNALNIVGGVDNPPSFLPGATVLEGCVDGYFTIFQPDLTTADTLELTISGTAQMGNDYEDFPTTVIIPEGEGSINVPLIPHYDSNQEGTESVTIQYSYMNSCGDMDTAIATMYIQDYMDMVLSLDELFVCPGENLQVSGTPQGGAPNFSYEWSTGSNSSGETFSQGESGNYSVSVTDFCGNTVSDEFVVSEPSPFEVIPVLDNCLGISSGGTAIGGATPYTYLFNEDSLDFNSGSGFLALFPGNYTIVTTDQCGQEGTTLLAVEECETKIPNVFTPNGDSDNDFFEIFGLEGFPKSALFVYNRWGTKVYDSENYKNLWGADNVEDGVYFYVFNRSDGQDFEGYVHVMRAK